MIYGGILCDLLRVGSFGSPFLIGFPSTSTTTSLIVIHPSLMDFDFVRPRTSDMEKDSHIASSTGSSISVPRTRSMTTSAVGNSGIRSGTDGRCISWVSMLFLYLWSVALINPHSFFRRFADNGLLALPLVVRFDSIVTASCRIISSMSFSFRSKRSWNPLFRMQW